jgi:hypothetical protein
MSSGLGLGSTDGSSSLAASLSMAVELLEDRIDTAAANRVMFWIGRCCVTFL